MIKSEAETLWVVILELLGVNEQDTDTTMAKTLYDMATKTPVVFPAMPNTIGVYPRTINC